MPSIPQSRATRRRVLAGLGGLAAAPLLAACSGGGEDPLAAQAGNADGKNYIAGDGSVQEFAPADRSQPVEFSTTLFSGEDLRAADLRGEPALLNFWYAACAPCRVEAPDLQSLHQEYGPQGVSFLGINVRDTVATAEAFERNYGIEYPSAEDLNGEVLLAMTDYVPPQAVPTTIVLDRQGRVSARVLGVIDRSIVSTLLDDVLAEQA